jgi:hypothetical protein
MVIILLEALLALLLLVLIVWWTMFSGRRGGELPQDDTHDDAQPAVLPAPGDSDGKPANPPR